MKVVIIGAGIGGLTAALACQRAGIDVSIYEKVEDPGEVGAGIQISPNGSKVLHALGLATELDRVACRPERVELRLGGSGALVLQMPLGRSMEKRFGAPYYHVHRADLHGILMDAVRCRCGNDAVRVGQALTGYDQADGQVTARFSGGESVTADALIGADGIHSKTREIMLGVDKPYFTGHVAWRGVVPAGELDHLNLAPVVTSWMSPHSHVVTYPIRRGELVNFVGIREESRWQGESWTERGTREALLADVADWHPTVRAIAEKIETPFRWGLFVRDPLPAWTAGSVTLSGDACHPMLPYMAQGAVMAIEDAWVLAACLGNADRIASALSRYQRLRLARTARVQKIARNNGRLFHLAGPLKRMAVFGGMALGARLLPGVVTARHAWIMSYDATKVAGIPSGASPNIASDA